MNGEARVKLAARGKNGNGGGSWIEKNEKGARIALAQGKPCFSDTSEAASTTSPEIRKSAPRVAAERSEYMSAMCGKTIVRSRYSGPLRGWKTRLSVSGSSGVPRGRNGLNSSPAAMILSL